MQTGSFDNVVFIVHFQREIRTVHTFLASQGICHQTNKLSHGILHAIRGTCLNCGGKHMPTPCRIANKVNARYTNGTVLIIFNLAIFPVQGGGVSGCL